jgi:6-phosphofructokinase 2
MTMNEIVTLTMNPSLDKNVRLEHVVAERKLRCEQPRYEPGGGGINVSRAIARLGGRSLAIYPAGGAIGEMLEELLDEQDLEHRRIEIEGMTRENLTVLEDASDRQFRFGMPGPTLSEPEWQRCLDALSAIDPPPDYMVASGSLPPGAPVDFYGRVSHCMQGSGCRLIVDTSGDELRAAMEAGVYLLKPNMRELGQLAAAQTGREAPIEDEEQLVTTAQEIVRRGQAEAVVVSLGAAGAVLVSDEATTNLRAPTVQIRSKIGAGDSMVAGIVRGLSQGRTLEDAVRYGVAAGSAAVITPGTELCRRQDTERLYERMASRESAEKTQE